MRNQLKTSKARKKTPTTLNFPFLRIIHHSPNTHAKEKANCRNSKPFFLIKHASWSGLKAQMNLLQNSVFIYYIPLHKKLKPEGYGECQMAPLLPSGTSQTSVLVNIGSSKTRAIACFSDARSKEKAAVLMDASIRSLTTISHNNNANGPTLRAD